MTCVAVEGGKMATQFAKVKEAINAAQQMVSKRPVEALFREVF